MTTPIPTGHLIWGLKIQGVGVPAGQLRFATEVPRGDTLGLYGDVLEERQPPRIQWGVDWRRHASTTGSAAFQMVQTPDVLRHLARLRAYPVTTLATSCMTGDTELDLGASQTGLAGEVRWIGREALLLGAETSAGVYEVTRGHLGTPELDHDVSDPTADLDVFAANPVLQGRRVELFWVPPSGGYDDETVVWSGVVDNRGHEEGIVAPVLGVRGVLGFLLDTQLMQRQWTGRVTGATATGRLSVRAVPPEWSGELDARPYALPSPASLGDEALIEVDGGIFALSVVRVGTSGSPTEYEFDPANALLGTPALSEDARGKLLQGGEVKEILCSAPITPGALPSDPFDLAVEVLTNTDWGVGMPEDLIDLDGIALVQRLTGGVQVERFFVGRAADQRAMAGLLQILAPLDVLPTVDTEGRLTLVRWSELPLGYEEDTLSDGDLLIGLDPAEDYGDADTLSAVRMTYQPPSLPPGTTRFVEPSEPGRRRRTLGAAGDQQVDASAYADRGLVYELAKNRLLKWRDPLPTIRVRVGLSKNLVVGRSVLLTLSGVTGHEAGEPVEGVTASRALVVGKTLDPQGNHHDYALLHIGIDHQRLGVISASARITAWSAGTNTATVEADDFVGAGGNGAYDFDAEAFSVGDFVVVLDQYGTEVITAKAVAARTSTTIQLAGTITSGSRPSGPVAGDVLIYASFGNCVAAQQTRDAFVADEDGLVDGESGYQYVF